jgi:hypothetical protein
VAAITGVATAVVNEVGPGDVTAAPVAVTATPITSDGKPQILYVGAEFCPYCAAERWAVVNALSRFGTWSNLSLSRSASDDVFPNTPTLTFHGATYTSQYVSFAGRELQGNEKVDGQYPPLDTLAPGEQAAFTELSPNGGFPFLDIGGRYAVKGATFDPGMLHGWTHEQIAQKLSDPTSGVTRAIVGAANSITKAICVLTDNQPADVCTAPGVTAAHLT